jgi:hypothetical protein
MVRMRVWAVVLAVAGVLATSGVAQAATVVVRTHGDPSGADVACPGPNCSLRQAIATADDGSTIVFDEPGTYTVDQGSPIVIPRSLTIDGSGGVTVDGRFNNGTGGTYRIFTVNSGVSADIENLTLTGTHNVIEHGPSTRNEDGGGALFVPAGATARVNRVEFAGNSAFVGGAVTSVGTLTVVDSWFHNDGAAFGAGIAVKGGTAAIDRTTLADEQGETGAVYVYAGARATITNSTVYGSGQANSRGGGVNNDAGTLTLVNDTLAGNLRGSLETNVGGTTSVKDTIIGDGFSDGDTDCVASGLSAADSRTTAKAITTDQGGNLDEDGSCGLTVDGGDHPDGAAQLAPLADNGGPVPTMALLHDSDALDTGADCAAVDERDMVRPQGAGCDIGAFEAVRNDPPAAATTEAATDVAPYSATLHATVDLTGEAGGAHFEYGTAPGQLTSQTAVAATGQGTAASVVLDGLQPNTTYYFRAVADNASGQRPADDPPLSFKTALSPPSVSGVEISGVDDTSATLSFDVDTGGADTSYVIEYGPDDTYGQSTAPVDIGSQPAQQVITAKLTGLKPGSAYHVNVVATNSSAPDGVSSGDAQFVTDPQVDADAGSAVTITDRQEADFCPDGATIDWGDGSPAAGALVSCDAQGFSMTASHAYTKPGHFKILIAYGDAAQSQQWALIAAPAQATPTPTPTPTPTAAPTATPTPPPPPPPAPQFHRQVVVKPVSGTVLVRLKGSKTFVPVSAATGVPLGSQVDVTHGRIRLSSVAKRGGKPQTAVFYGGIFTVTQPGSITDLRLSGAKPTCRPRGKAAVAATRHKKVRSRSLWGDGHGNFRTRGTYSAATVRGTKWFVQDTCAGTLTRVVRGVVSVRDNVHHRTRLLRAGQHYLARPRKH